jgi:basic membrane protein A and related proteins
MIGKERCVSKQAILSARPAVVAMLLTVLGGMPGMAGAQDGTPAPLTTVNQVALVTPASRTNQGWDQQAADNLEAVAAALGIEAVVVENGGYGDIAPILRDLAADGAQLIICHASGYQTTCPEFAQSEEVPVAVVENPGAVLPGLVSDVETQAQEAAYVAGFLSGLLTKTGTVGIVVSDEPPSWNYMSVGFAEGLKASKPDAKLLYSVVGVAAYDDSAGAKRVTETVLAAGADIVFGMGDGASFGMIEAVSAHNADNPDAKAMFIDVIGDKSATQPRELLLTSVIFDFSATYEQMIRDLDAGAFGSVYTLTLANGGVRLLDLPDTIPQEIKDQVAQVQADIVAGTITVSAIGDAEGMKIRLDELFPEA